MVTTFYPPYHFGGDGTYVRALSRALTRRGHEVVVVHCEDAYKLKTKGHVPKQDEAGDIRVHRLKSRSGFISPLVTQQLGIPGLKSTKLRRIFDDDFDVVNFHNISLIGGPGVISLSRAKVNIFTLHEHWLLCPTHTFWKNKKVSCDSRQCIRCCIRSGIPPQLWRYTSLATRSLEKIDRFISPSNYTARKHREFLTLPAQVEVIPLFSMLSPKQHTYTGGDMPEFVYVGRMTASKGVGELLSSFAKWKEYRLTMIGDGELLEELRRKYRHCDNISFLGQLPQHILIEHYRRARALILPSLAPETFGLTVVEAFACGTPAIVRAAGGNRETIDSAGAGFVYESEEQLFTAVQKLASDASLRVQLGRRAREVFESRYTEEVHVSRYLELVESLIQKKSSLIGSRVV
jgi:glycosyltransferase involved in cell wall biosynthesis